MHGEPALARVLVAVLILARRVEDRDAERAVRIDCARVSQTQACAARDALFGCHMGVMKRSLGGLRGKSVGKDMRALKKPPSLDGRAQAEWRALCATGERLTRACPAACPGPSAGAISWERRRLTQ